MFDVLGVTRVSLAQNATSRQRAGDHAVLAHNVGLENPCTSRRLTRICEWRKHPPCSNCIRTHSVITIWPIRWPNQKCETRLRLPYAPSRSTLFHSSAHHHLVMNGQEQRSARTPRDPVRAGGARQLKENLKYSSYV